ncbi:hypothetical protein YC2023_080932 [Brassica napus]
MGELRHNGVENEQVVLPERNKEGSKTYVTRERENLGVQRANPPKMKIFKNGFGEMEKMSEELLKAMEVKDEEFKKILNEKNEELEGL